MRRRLGPVVLLWRQNRRRSGAAVVMGIVLLGLAGGVAFGAVAGARRTASTFAAYEDDVRLSDLAVNTFVPDLGRVETIAGQPGVTSSATYLGLDAYPVIDGVPSEDFRLTGVFGSYDGRFFDQDRATVVDGRLPHPDATDELALSPTVAEAIGVEPGDEVTYAFRSAEDGSTLGEHTYEVTGLVRLPPVVVNEFDVIEGAILPPAATAEVLDSFYYAWQGLRLEGGSDAVGGFVANLRDNPELNDLPVIVQRYDVVRTQAQRSVRPQAVALGLFGVAAAIATLALGAQAVSRSTGRWSEDVGALRALGLTRRQAAASIGMDATVMVMGASVVAVVLAVLLSPLAPVGAARVIAPDTGVAVDLTVLPLGVLVLAVPLLLLNLLLAYRLTAPAAGSGSRRRPFAVALIPRGLPTPAGLGARFALDPGHSRQPVPVRTTIVAGMVAVVAVVAAAVFGTSLSGLVSTPDRYGWSWDRTLIAQAGYGSLPAETMRPLVGAEQGVDGWTLMAFDDLSLGDEQVPTPVIGIDQQEGSVAPPVTEGRLPSGSGEIAVGARTLRSLGAEIGDVVPAIADGAATDVTIVGTVTLPSVGVGGADNPSLGRGAVMPFASLAELVSPGQRCGTDGEALCPSAIAIDLAPGADGDAVVEHIAAADPDGLQGGTYEQPIARAADIKNFDEMRSYPFVLAGLLAAAAIAALLATLVASVRSRRQDLAVLRVMGLNGRQLRSLVRTQSALVALAALVVGIPLGVVVGRFAWTRFADDVGVVPVIVVPVLAISATSVLVVLVCTALAAVPARVASRTATVRSLRPE